jgi:hypothetical protein
MHTAPTSAEERRNQEVHGVRTGGELCQLTSSKGTRPNANGGGPDWNLHAIEYSEGRQR